MVSPKGNIVTIDPPSAIGERIMRDGPYDTELTIGTILSGALGGVYFTVLSHLDDAFLYSLLVEEGEYDAMGYGL